MGSKGRCDFYREKVNVTPRQAEVQNSLAVMVGAWLSMPAMTQTPTAHIRNDLALWLNAVLSAHEYSFDEGGMATMVSALANIACTNYSEKGDAQ